MAKKAKEPASTASDKRSVEEVLNGSGTLDLRALETLLWSAASSIRGPVEAPKFKDYILPLVFLKRLSDVFEDELASLTEALGETADKLVARDHGLVRFYIPTGCRWEDLRKLTTNVGQQVTDIARRIAKENPALQGVVDVVDFNATVSGQRILSDARLERLIEKLSKHRLGLDDVEPDVLGRAYEFLLRKFAEGQGTSAGEHFTPKEVGWLLAGLMRPEQGMSVNDPAAGSAGLLIKQQLWLQQGTAPVTRPLQLYGQEINHVTFAIGKMNMMIHDMEGEMAIGDTLVNPRFVSGGKLTQSDIGVANPMWNQPDYDTDFYEADSYDRFGFGYPPAKTADWGWMQHILASLKDKGRGGVVLDAAAVTRGSGGDNQKKERNIRERFVEEDLIEAVILLPEDIFYNTPAQGLIVVVNKAKPKARSGQVLLIDASAEFVREKPKSILTEAGIDKVVAVFEAWDAKPGFSHVASLAEVRKMDYNLNPGRYLTRATTRTAVDVATSLKELVELRSEETALDAGVVSAIETLQTGASNGVPSGWSEAVFEDVADIQLGKTPARKNRAYWPGHGEDGDVPWVTITDMAGRRIVTETKEKVTSLAADEVFKDRLVPSGTLLMSFKLTIGRTAFMGIDGFHNEAIVSIYPNEDEVLGAFLYYSLPLLDYTRYQDRAVKGQTLNSGKIKKIQLILPPPAEQEAIVELLDSVRALEGLEGRIAMLRETLGDELTFRLVGGRARLATKDG